MSVAASIGLGLGVVGVLVFLIAMGCVCERWGTLRRFRQAGGVPVPVSAVDEGVRRRGSRWETFKHNGGFVWRMAMVLDYEDAIPEQVASFLRDENPIAWCKLPAEGPPEVPDAFVERAAWCIKALVDMEADLERSTASATLGRWRAPLIEACGGEWSHRIMDRVGELVAQPPRLRRS